MAKKETLTSEDIDKALAESMLTEEFDVKAASDTEGFLEFLALFDDSKNGEHDPAAMQERFEIFKMKNEIVEDIKDIWHNEISDEIGIELSEEELGFVNEYLEGEAVENPMRLKQMKEQVANYYELPKLIESTNKDLMDLTTTAETAIKGTGILGSIRMYGGLALTEITGKTNTGTESYHAQRSMMEQAGIPANRRSLEARRVDLGSNAEEIQGEFAQLQSVKLEALEGLSNKLATIKQELFLHAGLRENFTLLAREKLKAQFVTMARESGLSALNNAAGFIKKNKFGRETDLIYLDSGTEQEMVEEVDTQAEEYIKDIVTKNLSEVALGDKALTRLRDALSEIIEAESAGSKDKKETAEFLVQTIRDAAKNMPTDRDGLAKKIRAEILTKELEKKIEDELSSETE